MIWLNLLKNKWIIFGVIFTIFFGYFQLKIWGLNKDINKLEIKVEELYSENSSLLRQREELKKAVETVNDELTKKDVLISSLKDKFVGDVNTYKNKLNIISKKYDLCINDKIGSMPANEAISKKEVIDYETSKVFIDIFNNDLFK